MPITALFPTEGDSIAAMSWHLQRLLLIAQGNGIDSGFGITRNSSSSVMVAAGVAVKSLAKVNVSQATLDSIPFSSAGTLRYDLVYVDLSDNTTKRLQGTESVPTGKSTRTPINDFLENYLPMVPALTSLLIVPLYALRITETGLVDASFGASPYYATHGIAPIYIGSPVTNDLFALLAGQSGGQTLYGGTAASDNLTLGSTANATKGNIYLGSYIYVDEANRIFYPIAEGIAVGGRILATAMTIPINKVVTSNMSIEMSVGYVVNGTLVIMEI